MSGATHRLGRQENPQGMGNPTRAVTRALDILLCFSEEEPELGLTAIAARLGLHKSTVHRLLATLQAERFVQRDPVTNSYRLGTRLLELAALVPKQSDLARRAWPHLTRLVQQYRETADLAVFDGESMVYLEVIQCSRPVRLAVAPGRSLSLHSTASGKACLAYLPEAQARRLVAADLARYTKRTLTDEGALWRDLELTRQRGFAIAFEEQEEGINAVAAPVLDRAGHPMAAIALAGPAFRLPLECLLEMAPAVRAAADAIAAEVGTNDIFPAMPDGLGQQPEREKGE